MQSELAAELGRLTGRSISAEMVQHWEAGRRPVSKPVRRAYGQVIANDLARETGLVIGITISANSPWRIHCWRECGRCGLWFEVRSIAQKYCGCGRAR